MLISRRTSNRGVIFDINSKVLTFEVIFELEDLIAKLSVEEKVIALNCQYVEYINSDFFGFLKDVSLKKNLSLINLQSEIFALLNLSECDKFVQIYLTDYDFEHEKRMLINRRFEIVK